MLTKNINATLNTYLQALESNPDDVQTLLKAGDLLLKQESSLAAAVKLLDRAATLVPDNASGWEALGAALALQRRYTVAAVALTIAERLAGDDFALLLKIADSWHRIFRPDRALTLARRVERLMPDDGAVALLIGTSLSALQRWDEAQKYLEIAASRMPKNPYPHLGLALGKFLQGDLSGGYIEYRWRYQLEKYSAAKYSQPEWLGGDAVGKTILVWCEQGLGDTLHFARYLPIMVARGAQILLDCKPELHALFLGMAGVSLYQANLQQRFDCHVALMSLPDLLGTTLENIPANVPYLTAPAKPSLPARPSTCRMRLGFVWAGSPAHINSTNRDCEIEQFLQLANHAGVECYSLQVGQHARDLAACGGDVLITPLGQHLQNMGMTASVLSDIDLLITVDTAVAHLAGALGRPVWVLLPYLPDWRWMLNRDDSPWYPSMRLFRQAATGDWNGVFERVNEALTGLLADLPLSLENVSPDTATPANRLRDEGVSAMKRGNPQLAKEKFSQVLRLSPLDSSIWTNLGIALRECKFFRSAIACYQRSLEIKPDVAGTWSNLGNVLNDDGQTAKAIASHNKAISLDPTSVGFKFNLGVTLRSAGQHKEAISYFSQVLEADPQHRDAPFDLSQSQLALGRYKEAWPNYARRWQLKEAGRLHRRGEAWQGQPFQGKTLLLLAEQGFGDTILAARFLPQVKALGGRVLLECQPELMRLIDKEGWVDAMFMKNSPPPEHYDYVLPMMSLPSLFVSHAKSIPTTPYLQADKSGFGMFANLIKKQQGRLNVGIIWSGSLTFKANIHRAQKLEAFLQFAAIPGVHLFSLQKGPLQEDLNKLNLSALVTDLAPLMLDFECTAAGLEMLDLIIMTDSSTAHLAGALGRPVWILLGSRPYWLWGVKGEHSPWYSSVRLLRQREPGNWDELFERAAHDLAELASKA